MKPDSNGYRNVALRARLYSGTMLDSEDRARRFCRCGRLNTVMTVHRKSASIAMMTMQGIGTYQIQLS